VKSAPVRTCVGCGSRAPQGQLVRLVAAGRDLVLDPRRRLPGRGAWLHREPACWGAFVERRGTVRSLRSTPSREAREALRSALMSAEGMH
jgi:predicted RNA-binding protein YlxR (DUF448 family)